MIYSIVKKGHNLQYDDVSDCMLKLIEQVNYQKSKGAVFEIVSDRGGRLATLYQLGFFSVLFIGSYNGFVFIDGTRKTNINMTLVWLLILWVSQILLVFQLLLYSVASKLSLLLVILTQSGVLLRWTCRFQDRIEILPMQCCWVNCSIFDASLISNVYLVMNRLLETLIVGV